MEGNLSVYIRLTSHRASSQSRRLVRRLTPAIRNTPSLNSVVQYSLLYNQVKLRTYIFIRLCFGHDLQVFERIAGCLGLSLLGSGTASMANSNR